MDVIRVQKVCRRCKKTFSISGQEMTWLKDKGLAPFEHCKECRAIRKAERQAAITIAENLQTSFLEGESANCVAEHSDDPIAIDHWNASSLNPKAYIFYFKNGSVVHGEGHSAGSAFNALGYGPTDVASLSGFRQVGRGEK